MAQMSQIHRWVIPVIVILVIALAIETTVLFYLIIGSGFGSQTFPRIVRAGCTTLTSTTVFSTTTNRTLLFECPGVGSNTKALIINAACQTCPFDSNPYYEIYRTTPTFILPTGYLALWLTSFVCADTTPATSLATGQTPLTSGQDIVVGGYYTSYNYCAVVDAKVSHPLSFTIDWSPGTLPVFRPAPFTINASPQSMTIRSGDTGNLTVTLASLGGWTGNVTIDVPARFDCNCPPYTTPASTIVKAGGTNTTTLSLPTCEYNGTICATLRSYTVRIEGKTDCLSRVQGICFDQYSRPFFNVQVNVT